MTYDPHALIIHIDGSAYNNPGGSGGVAGIVEYPESSGRDSEVIFEIGFSSSTNNRMELQACIKALKWAREHAASLSPARILILTDSNYVSQFHRSAPFWKKAKWRTGEGRPIENSDLWKEFLQVKSKVAVRTDIEWERGKVNSIAKDVDKKAKQAAKQSHLMSDPGFRPGKLSRAKLPGIAASLFPAKGQQALIRIYRKDYIYRFKQKECKIYFELFLQSEGIYLSKHFCYATPEIESQLHRHHHYKVQFNENLKYPIIEEVVESVE